MQLISKYNKGTRYLLCVIDVFTKYIWVVLLKYKKSVTITNPFDSIFKKCDTKLDKVRTNQGSEFYNKSFKKMSQDNDIKMYSTFSEGKSVVAEKFIRTLKNKIYKHMTAVSKNVYFDDLDDIVGEYNNAYHRTIKMKPIDVKGDSFPKYNEESNEKDSRFKVGNQREYQKTKISLLKDILQIGVKKFLWLKMLKIQYRGLI